MKKRALPHMRALQTFEVAARTLSFTRAAERLGIAQPAVARYVSELEAYISTSLFVRDNNKLSLTPEGRQLAGAIEDGLGRIQNTLSSIEQRRRNKLIIAASFEFAHLWLMPRLSAIREALGAVQPQIFAADDYQDHHRAGIDLSVQFWPLGKAGNHAVLLFQETAFPAASPTFVEKNRDSLSASPSSWPAEWLIEIRPDGRGHLTWDDWFRENGLEPASGERQYHDSYLTALEAMAAGEGIGFAVPELAHQHLARGDLIPVGESSVENDAGYYLLHERANTRGAEIAERLAGLSATIPDTRLPADRRETARQTPVGSTPA